MLKRTKIITRLLVGFSLILICCLILGIIGSRSITSLSDMTARIFHHPFAVTRSILEIKANLHNAQKTVSNLAHYATPSQVSAYERRLKELSADTDRHVGLIRERYLGPQSDVDLLATALHEWRAARNDVIEHMRHGQRAEALAISRGSIMQLGDDLLERVDAIATFAHYRAQKFKLDAEQNSESAQRMIFLAFLLTMAGGIALSVLITRSVRESLVNAKLEVQRLMEGSAEKTHVVEAISSGDLSRDITVGEPLRLDLDRLPSDELGELLRDAVRLSEMQFALDQAFLRMTSSLRSSREIEQAADWLKSGLNELNSLIRDEQRTKEMAEKVLNYLVPYLKAGAGALYLFDEQEEELAIVAGYALSRRESRRSRFRLGEGLIGQVALERRAICIADVPPDYLSISSGIGNSEPASIVAIPLLHGARLVGALEIGSFHALRDCEREFLDLASIGIAIGLSVNQSRQHLSELLEETRRQAEELRVQQEELQQSNEELEERADLLEQQREQIRAKNREIEEASNSLRQKADELERINTFKSEFLANMSHELRTPLNSMMILSSVLMQNKEGNLSERQVNFAATINSAGSDLLDLISDILDLSKVEAGHMEFQNADIAVQDMADALGALFEAEAEKKRLAYRTGVDTGVPATFSGDEQRVRQILKNLLSNAFKFTENGSVSLDVFLPAGLENPLPVPAIAFAVSDTGIGISPEKQQLIFQAFQQADGSISRKYGGTGLGLSISLQLARKMQGDIRLISSENQGSVFTLYLPLAAAGTPCTAIEPALPAPSSLATLPAGQEFVHPESPVPDDRAQMREGDMSILVIDGDIRFIRILGDAVRQRGFALLAATDGESGIALAERHVPSAIILDVMLPRLDGWSVMRELKDNPRTRHIPVHFITSHGDRQKAMSMAAIGFAAKPVGMDQLNGIFRTIEDSVSKANRSLLIVEDDSNEACGLVALFEGMDIEISVASSGEEAIDLISNQAFDCIVLDLGLAGMSGLDLMEHINGMGTERCVPIIIHSGRDLNQEEEKRLRSFAERIIVKGAKSPERLLDEVTLFLHQAPGRLHPDKQRMICLQRGEDSREDCKVLLVDDDARNIFSLTNLLEERNMTVIEAENGREAIARISANPDVEVILMDIMMPDTDGLTAIREIRKDPRFASIPIIAMTAKTMKGDYEKCMEAGASDYISKPIDTDKLLSLISVWSYRRPAIS